MKAVTDMTPAELLQEAHRRSDRRAKGLPLAEDPELAPEMLKRIQEQDERAEKAIQAEILKLYQAFGCTVYSTSQYRASKISPGTADLIVFHDRAAVAWWMEVKTPQGTQSPAQIEFMQHCIATGWGYVLGGVLAAEEQLIAIGAAERINGKLEPKR